MVGISTQKNTTFTLVPHQAEPMYLRSRVDFVAMDETTDTQNEVEAPIVWMGYGIDAPEFNWNDYQGADVRGKVLLMMVNQPPSDDPKFFTGKSLTYYGRWTYKFEEAARMGAVGVILIHKTDMASYGCEVVRIASSPECAYCRLQRASKPSFSSGLQIGLAYKSL